VGECSRQPKSPTLETIESLLKSSDVKTRIEGQSLFFAALVGETEISVSPSGYKTLDGLEVSEIIRITSAIDMPPVPWNEGMECKLNMTASNGAVINGNDGKIRIVSRLSLYEGENGDAIKAYMGVTFFAALIHTYAFHNALVDAWRSPVPKAQPLPDCSADGVWKPMQFIRATSLLNKSGIFANGDERGLTAEFPWDLGEISVGTGTLVPGERRRTSLLQIHCEEHPSLGKGLFCRLDLPLNLSDDDAFSLAIRLNRMESTVADWPPLLGAWTSRPNSGRPTFVSFWPNIFARVIGVEMIAIWMQARAGGAAWWIDNNIDTVPTVSGIPQ
jgi:hypothetical protein